jgi:nicotinate-nucleotide adenylyltransferase
LGQINSFLLIVFVMKSKVILFGGTFDPIHYGHTRACLYALEQTSADKVVFIPAKCSPHKRLLPVASEDARLAMLRLAVAGESRFEISACELERSSPSYTIDTVRFFRSESGDNAELYWLVGADAIKDLSDWYEVKNLIDECNLCVMRRGGFERPDFGALEGVLGVERVEKLKKNVIEGPLVDISSSEIRRKIGAGEEIRGMVSEAVEAYICENGLYKVC